MIPKWFLTSCILWNLKLTWKICDRFMVKYGRPSDEKQVKNVNVNGYIDHLTVIKLCVQAIDWDQRIVNAAGDDSNVSRTMVYERHKNWHQKDWYFLLWTSPIESTSCTNGFCFIFLYTGSQNCDDRDSGI